MKTKAKKQKTSLKQFEGKKINNTKAVVGGTSGPIDRDRLRKPRSS